MLPPNFPYAQLASTDLHRVEWYYGRFVEQFFKEYRFGHFILAGYASVPALLTPDLLYKIWQNFYGYTWGRQELAIHRIAVADLLLSPLCKEVGFELYEMHHDLRMAFQQWLNATTQSPEWKGRGVRSVDEIAAFVQEYHAKPNPGAVRWGQGYMDVQDWGATAYADHEKVQQQLNLRLLQALQSGREAEALRLMDIWAKTAQQLEGLYANQPEKDLSSLRNNAQMVTAWKSLLQEGDTAFLQKLEQIGRDHPFFNNQAEGGIAVQVPSLTKERVEEIQVQTVWCLAIAIDKYTEPLGPLEGTVKNAKTFVDALKQVAKLQGQTFRSKSLLDNKATVRSIKEQFDYFDKAREGDICVLYFAGRVETHDIPYGQGRGLIAVDSRTGADNGDIYQAQVEAYIQAKITHTAVQFICVYDAYEVNSIDLRAGLDEMPHRRTPQNMKGSLLVLSASNIGHQYRNNGQFTVALLEILTNSVGAVTYRQLIRRIKQGLTEGRVQDAPYPFLEAFPNAAQDRFFLSDRIDKTGIIPLKYDKEKEQWWTLVPDSDTVLRPSLDFYHTLLRPFDALSPLYKVVPIQTGAGLTLEGFDGGDDLTKVYEMVMVQHAPEKIAVAFDPIMDKKVKDQLWAPLKARQNRHFYVENDPTRAKLFFNNRGESFVLRKNLVTSQTDPFSILDVLALGTNGPSFIGSVERACRWLIIAGLGGAVTNTALELKYEVVEGMDLNNPFAQPAAFNGTVLGALPAPLKLHYKKNGEEWFQPVLQYEVTNKSAAPIYVQAVIMDTNYNVTVQTTHRIEPGQAFGPSPSTGAQHATQQNIVQQSNTTVTPEAVEPIPFTLDIHDFNMGIREKPAFLKVFVSSQALDLYPLSMSAAERAATKGSGRLTEAKDSTILEGDTGLACFTIPLLVVREALEYQAAGPAPTGSEAPPPPTVEYATVDTETLMVVDKPGGPTVVRQLKKGDRVEIVERQGEWVRIQNLLGIVATARDFLDKGDFGKAFAILSDLRLNALWAEVLDTISARYFDLRREREIGNVNEEDYNRRESELQGQFYNLLGELDQVQEWVQALFEVAPEAGAEPDSPDEESVPNSPELPQKGLESLEETGQGAAQQIYVVYAAADEAAWKSIEQLLRPFVEQGKVVVAANHPEEKKSDAAVQQSVSAADMVFLLLSKHFLGDSNVFRQEDVTQAVAERMKAGQKVIPIVLDDCNWESTYFGALRTLPSNTYPIDSYENPAEVWANIGASIKELLDGPQLA